MSTAGMVLNAKKTKVVVIGRVARQSVNGEALLARPELTFTGIPAAPIGLKSEMKALWEN
eukprot:5958890-Amphidinium_carterae.1